MDDGFALLQALRSPELRVAGVSTVFGNASRAVADRVAEQLLRLAGASRIPRHAGAARAESLGEPTAASLALAASLRERALTVLALGPLTNIATVIAAEPGLASRIERLVFVGGRRPGQRFLVGDRGPLPDFNVECDPAACELVLKAGIPLTLTGFEVSTCATLTSAELDRLAAGPPAARWLAENSHGWLRWWREHLDHDGFHPFDTFAVAAAATPELIELRPAAASLVRTDASPPGDAQLQVRLDRTAEADVSYATRATGDFTAQLMSRLLA